MSADGGDGRGPAGEAVDPVPSHMQTDSQASSFVGHVLTPPLDHVQGHSKPPRHPLPPPINVVPRRTASPAAGSTHSGDGSRFGSDVAPPSPSDMPAGEANREATAQEASFLSADAGNGEPRISERHAHAVSNRIHHIVSGGHSPSSVQAPPRHSAGLTHESSGVESSADIAMRDGGHVPRRQRSGQLDQPQVSFHVNPNFDEDQEDSNQPPHYSQGNSDVLVQGFASHNMMQPWQKQACMPGPMGPAPPQGAMPQENSGPSGNSGHQGYHSSPHAHSGPQAHMQFAASAVDDEGALLSPGGHMRAPTSPASSRYPFPMEPPSPGNNSVLAGGGVSNLLDRHYHRGARSRATAGAEIYHSVGGQSGSVAATQELANLIERAKHLLQAPGASADGRSAEMQRLLATNMSYQAPPSEIGMNTNLLPVQEDQAMDADELLQMHLDAKDNLRSAYAMLNEQYSSPEAKSLTVDALSELDSAERNKKNSGSFKSDDDARKIMHGEKEWEENPFGANPVRMLSHNEYLDERQTERRAKRMVRLKLFPMILYILFILSAMLYAYVRIVHGMGGLTLPLTIYSYVVLVVEMLGGLNMIFYGCWLFAKPVNADVFPPPDRDTGKEAPFRRSYNVRVLIPCYKESLAIIQRTVLAAKRADRPPGMKLVIYVCDDGNDEKKIAWVQRMNDPEVKYVTGRDKSQKQLNGKSANLNFCLTKLYPDMVDPENPDELMKIPVNELMCLFDADQTCSKGFFMTMLRYIDSGDDVGVALSPQLMYNVIPDCDVFNHQNVHFWEMMQPGMDALGFISLTGTNMILRSRALHQAGWFPMNSVTEDWALGMRFKKLGYRCRYVNQYLAIGEAPDVTQQAFQQRSRWSKGHFQVFWSRECPLFDNRLNLFYRLAYSSTCVSYLSTGLSVIVLNLVPVLTILIGWFPIALNFYTVVGITAYFTALNALSFYCLSWSHYKALWLANNSSVILFWPYLKASILTPIKSMMGRTMVFKTTLKGAAAHNASLKVLGPSLLLVIINVVTFILGIVSFHAAVNAAQGISLCWLVFNTVPHINLLFYSAFGPGGFMVGWCRIGMLLTTASSVLAIILMWLLYPREVDFERPLQASINFLEAEQSGPMPVNSTVPWRSDSGLQYRKAVVDGEDGVLSKYRPQFSLPAFNVSTDLSGGFYEDGPYGPVKLTKSNALATAQLSWALLDLPGPFEDEPMLMARSLEKVEHGLKYLLNCYFKDPTDYGNPQGDIYVYQVGDIMKERARWFRPEDVKTREKIFYTGGVAAPIDLTAQMAAGIVSSTMVLHRHGRIPNKDVTANFKIVRSLYNVTMTIKGVLEHNRDLWHSDSFYDDRLWAATWMYRAATAQYLPQQLASRYYTDMVDSMTDANVEERTHIVSQDYVLNMGIIHAATNTYNWEFHAPAQSFIWDWICSGKVDYTKFGRAWAEKGPLLGDTVLAAALAQLYAIKMKGWKHLASKFERGFQCFAQQQARYLVGTGWQRRSFIQGVKQDKGFSRLVHRGASCPPYPERCPQNTGASNHKDINIVDGGLLWTPKFTDKPQDTRGSNATAVSLGNNAAMPLLFAGLLEKTNSWMECLISDGALLKHPVCAKSRPVERTDVNELPRRQFWGRVFDQGRDDNDLANGNLGAYPLTRNLGPLPRFKLNPSLYEKDLVSLAGNGWLFYEAQRSGKLPSDNKIPWRGDSFLTDGSALTPPRNLSGGWYDAGDSLKITMPFCSAVWRLAWSLISYKQTNQQVRFQQKSMFQNGLRQLQWAAEYLEKIHYTNTTLVAMVGDINIDHNKGPNQPLVPEQYLASNVARPVIEINGTSGGADLLGEAASAFAAIGFLMKDLDGEYSSLMTKHARQLYDWMQLTPGTAYSRVHPQLQSTYPSQVPHAHMMLAAAWMFRLTGESKFEVDATSFHSRAREQQTNPVVGWRNPLQEAKLLLLEANPNDESTWLPSLMEYVDSQMFGEGVAYSRKGLWYVQNSSWGALRNAAGLAHVALRTAAMVDRFATEPDDAHMIVWAHHARCLARQQMNYVMGSTGRSYVTGWGEKPPAKPHHRGASCAFVQKGEQCTGTTWNNKARKFPNTLPGGLVGGPSLFDTFKDNHLDFVQSEVSLDYNAALVSSVSSMMQLPAHFWQNTNFCPKFPIPTVNWLDVKVKPVPGVTLPDTPEDGALVI